MDVLSGYRTAKETKTTEQFLDDIINKLSQKHSVVDEPGATPFRAVRISPHRSSGYAHLLQKIRNWFGNYGRPDRRPHKVSQDGDKEGSFLPASKARAKPTKSVLASKERLVEMFRTKKRKCLSIETYRTTNWDKGLKERTAAAWAAYKLMAPAEADLTANARASFDNRFVAMELANQPVEVKRDFLEMCNDAKSKNMLEGVSTGEREHIQRLVDLSEYASYIFDLPNH